MATSDYNPFGDFHSAMLSADPQAAYMGAISRSKPPGAGAGVDPWGHLSGIGQERALDFLSGDYQKFRNRFLARRGQELYEKKDPATITSFSDFLSQETDPSQGGTPFTERYARQTPYTKGTSQSRFSPSTRFIYY